MEPGLTAAQITFATVEKILARYDDFIRRISGPAPAKSAQEGDPRASLEQLNQWRLHQLPAVLQQRTREDADAWLAKDEVEDLIRWKLKHGHFRPRMMSLVSSNSEDDIRMTTAKAFKAYAARPGPAPTEALSVLCSLRGIGPASASLLLSVYRPEEVPFFSDEGYRWMMYEEGRGKGWDRTIRYDAKCYGVYFASVRRLKDRLKDEGHSVPAADVERVGYVISKEVEEARVSARPSRLKRRAATEAPSAPKAGSKRKRATEKEGANA